MPERQVSDATIVRRVQDGDREAYRVLVDRYGPMVFRILRRYCKDEVEVEDLAQDVFVRAYQNLKGFRSEAKFSSWLYRIAANRGKDYVKSARFRRHDYDAEAERLSGSAESPQARLVGSERADMVRQALGELSPDYATAFLLKYEMDLTYKEIAVMMDTTVGALKVRVHRARKQLRTMLDGRL